MVQKLLYNVFQILNVITTLKNTPILHLHGWHKSCVSCGFILSMNRSLICDTLRIYFLTPFQQFFRDEFLMNLFLQNRYHNFVTHRCAVPSTWCSLFGEVGITQRRFPGGPTIHWAHPGSSDCNAIFLDASCSCASCMASCLLFGRYPVVCRWGH